MTFIESLVNRSQEEQSHRSRGHKVIIASDEVRDIIQIVNYVFLCSGISVLGIVTNIINLVVFYKQGLDTTINISFFALAISDLCSLIMQLVYNVFVNPWLEQLGVPGSASGVQFITGGIPRECFARITIQITAYVTAERCLCIAFPLHVKQMITPKRTVVIMSSMYILTIVSLLPLYCITYVDWRFYPDTNTTKLGLVFRNFSAQVEGVVTIEQAIIGSICFLAVVVFTLILIHKLSHKNTWKKSVSDSSESVSSRDRKTMVIVTFIAAIVIVCYTPSVLLLVGTFIEPEFSVGGAYSNLYVSGWSVACVFECINSSVNMFLYYTMSTRYRTIFSELFLKEAITNVGRE